MGLLTNFLGLFKYDPSTDGLDTFNVRTALNENWDKIDLKAKDTEESLNTHKVDNTIHHTIEAIQDVVGNLIQAGNNVSVTYDDQNNQIQISSSYTDTNTQRSDEEIRDLTAAFIKAGTNVSISHNDVGNELTITADLSAASILSKLKTVDGAGCGIDADLLDGKHASAFQLAGTYNTSIGTDADINTSGAIIIDNLYFTDGVCTSHGVRTLTPANIGAVAATDYFDSDVLAKVKAVDGTGSGLDADLLDGWHRDSIRDWNNILNKPSMLNMSFGKLNTGFQVNVDIGSSYTKSIPTGVSNPKYVKLHISAVSTENDDATFILYPPSREVAMMEFGRYGNITYKGTGIIENEFFNYYFSVFVSAYITSSGIIVLEIDVPYVSTTADYATINCDFISWEVFY